MNKLLIAVDGSPSAERAVAQVIADLGDRCRPPELHLLYVHPPLPVGRVQAFIGEGSLTRYYREESLPYLAGAERLLQAADAPYTRHLHVGPAAETIVRVADELGCDTIVLGNGGHGRLAGAALGSVAHAVLHRAVCPVLLVK